MNCIDFEKIISEDTIIIDIRDCEDYYRAHIPNSKNINHIELILHPNLYLEVGKIYYIICDQGKVSSSVIKMLKDTQYKLININDGFDNWKGPIASLC